MGNRKRFASIDGIKGLALIAVIVYHFSTPSLGGGFIGVEVLFVISGLLTTSSLLRGLDGDGLALGRFYMRRLARLLPALLVMTLAVVAAGRFIDTDTLVGIQGQSIAAMTFSYNWYDIVSGGSYFANAAPQLLRHVWYVALLAQFLLVLPLLVAVVHRIAPRPLRPFVPALLAVASAAAMWIMYVPGADPTRVYFGTDTHAFGLLAGVTAAWVLHDLPERAQTGDGGRHGIIARMLPWAATAALCGLIALAVLIRQDQSAFRGGLIAAALLTLVLLIGSIGEDSWMRGLLEWRPLALIGKYSYGIYLWHWPLYVLLQGAFPQWRAGMQWALWSLALALTVMFTALSWRFVERPSARIMDGLFSARTTRRARTAAPRVVSGRGTSTAVPNEAASAYPVWNSQPQSAPNPAPNAHGTQHGDGHAVTVPPDASGVFVGAASGIAQPARSQPQMPTAPIRRSSTPMPQAVGSATPNTRQSSHGSQRRNTMAVAANALVAAVVAVLLCVGYGTALAAAPAKTKLQISLEAQQARMAAQQKENARRAAEQAAERKRQQEQAAAQADAQRKAAQAATVDGTQVTAIGDSVMLDASDAMSKLMPGVNVDAEVSRSVLVAPGIISQLKASGQLRKYIVIGLNTNGAVTVADFQAIADAAGEGHVLIIVNGYGDRTWIPVGNQAASDYVKAHKDSAVLVDWNTAIAPHLDWLYSDGIHPVAPGPGADLYAQQVHDAIVSWQKQHVSD